MCAASAAPSRRRAGTPALLLARDLLQDLADDEHAEADGEHLQAERIGGFGAHLDAEEPLGQVVQLAPFRCRLVGDAELGEQSEQEHADAVEQREQTRTR